MRPPKTVKRRISATSILHFVKLFVRAFFFLAALALYVMGRVIKEGGLFMGYERFPWLLAIIGLVYALEMAIRFLCG